MLKELKYLENQCKSFTQRERLVNRKVKVHQVGTAQHGAFRVSEQVCVHLAGGKRRKNNSSLIEPAIESLVTRIAAAERCLSSHVKGEIFRVVNHIRTRRGTPRCW